jgi:hypothetical protein
LYGTVKGIEFQQGLPDLDNLDPREKHLIILDDLMDETDQRVASLFTKKSQHTNIEPPKKTGLLVFKYNRVLLRYSVCIAAAAATAAYIPLSAAAAYIPRSAAFMLFEVCSAHAR